jgi:hypothetical protein
LCTSNWRAQRGIGRDLPLDRVGGREAASSSHPLAHRLVEHMPGSVDLVAMAVRFQGRR